jgi:membrane protease YdiL (CAAX protease family)
MSNRDPTRASIALELAVLLATTILFLTVFRTRPPYVDPVLATLALAAIFLTRRRSLRLWELNRRAHPLHGTNTTAAIKGLALCTAVAFMVLAAVGLWLAGPRGEIPARFLNWHMLVALLLYFPWAALQQYLLQFYLFGRLQYVLPTRAAVLVTALCFCCMHYPRPTVMALTAAAGVVWALHYLRYGRLLPIAVSHAVLATALHYWVFGRDLADIWGVLAPR